jgi:hypothetical protein
MPEQATSFNTWAIVEVIGHKKFAGYVTEQTFGVATLIRVDVPATEQPSKYGLPARSTAEYSKLIGVGSIYCITPCTEEVARKCATALEAHKDPIPVAIPEERRIPASVGAQEEQLDEFTVDDELDGDDDDR